MVIPAVIISVIYSGSLPISRNPLGAMFFSVLMFVKIYSFNSSIAGIFTLTLLATFIPYMIMLVRALRQYNVIYDHKIKLDRNKIDLFENDTIKFIRLGEFKL